MKRRPRALPAWPVLVTVWGAALAAGCAAPPPVGEPTGERRTTFRCANGETIEVRFFPLQGVAVLVRDGRTAELQQQPAASGYWYTNGPLALRGQGDQLRLEVGRMAPIPCRAR